MCLFISLCLIQDRVRGSGQDPPNMKKDPMFPRSAMEGGGGGGAAGPSVLPKHGYPPVFFLSIKLGLS